MNNVYGNSASRFWDAVMLNSKRRVFWTGRVGRYFIPEKGTHYEFNPRGGFIASNDPAYSCH
jgi:hypothetical protein